MEGEPTQPQGQPEEHQPGLQEAERAELEQQIVPRIYVASLSDYNAGRLHGTWLDANQEPEDMHRHINAMLARSTEPHAEEWAIHDFEGFNGLHLGEWEDLGHVSRVAKGISEHGLAYGHWATLVSQDEELDQFEEAYHGHWETITDYAETLLDDFGLERQLEAAVPESLRPYVKVDAEAFGRDLQLGGDVTAIEGDGGVYVFRPQ
jgi:antirestriction protein